MVGVGQGQTGAGQVTVAAWQRWMEGELPSRMEQDRTCGVEGGGKGMCGGRAHVRRMTRYFTSNTQEERYTEHNGRPDHEVR